MEGVILSSWDYIMGPQIERLWITKKPKLTSEVSVSILREFNISKHNKQNDIERKYNCKLKTYSLMCGQLLLGEIDAYERVEQNVSRTYISDFQILLSVVFHMPSWICVGTTKIVNSVSLCLGVIYKRDAFNFILRNQLLLDTHLRKLVEILQKAKLPNDTIFKELSAAVMDLTSLLDSLYHSNLLHVQNNYIMLSIEDNLISGILPEVIVSHLQTSGHTAVLGGSEFKINQVVNILSLFSSAHELNSSLSTTNWPLRSIISSFYIQGIIKSSDRDREYLLEYAFDNSMPLTVVDIDLCRVWQTWPFHENVEKNRVSCTMIETGHLVPKLLDDLSFGHKNSSDCQIILENFTKLLMMKAAAVIKTISHFRETKRILSKQELMILFAIYTLDDLQIILGCAEKLKPGIRCSVL